jgi:Dolichyl-phosphate-mannose-protein mannosyltransferase
MRGPVQQILLTPEELVEAPADVDRDRQPLSTRAAAAVLGGAMGVVTAAVYLVGAGRSINEVDSSVTVGAFVKTPSLLDPLRRTLDVPGFRFNNHPLFSFLEHAVWSAGLHSETALRIIPVVFAAVAVGLLATECARRFGLVAGFCAGAVLATNPFFASVSRELRDYSLVVLCAVASSILLIRILESDESRARMRVGYSLVVAAGLATHLWFALVLVAHLAVVFAQRKWDRRWVAQWTMATVLGLSVYVRIVADMFSGQRNGFSNASFPTKTARLMLGHQWIAVAILGGFVVWAVSRSMHNRAVVLAALTVGAMIAFVWLVIQPQGLGPRFVIWLVPLVALSAAVVVARKPWAAALVAVALLAMVADQAPSWSTSSPNIARAAAIVDAARARGLRVCGYKAGQWAVLAYTTTPPYMPPEGVVGCDVVVEMEFPHTKYDDVIRAELPNVWREPGKNPIVIFTRTAIRPMIVPPPELSLDAHPRTYPSP